MGKSMSVDDDATSANLIFNDTTAGITADKRSAATSVETNDGGSSNPDNSTGNAYRAADGGAHE